MTTLDLSALVSSAEAAQILGTSSGTVSRMGQGTHQTIRLERIRVGREFFYSRREVEAAVPRVRHRKAPATPPAPAPAEPTVSQGDRIDMMRAAIQQQARHTHTLVDAIAVQTDWNTTALRKIASELGVTL